MYRILSLLLVLIFISACYSKHHNTGNYFTGDHVHSKKNKDITASKEILLTSLFFATSHVPEEIKTDIEIFDKGKSYLSKEAKKRIADFTEDILIYEDYSIIIEGHADIYEAASEEDCQKLSEKRADAVEKALIKNGIDKDKIKCIGVGASKPASKGVTAKERKQNRRVVIEAELW